MQRTSFSAVLRLASRAAQQQQALSQQAKGLCGSAFSSGSLLSTDEKQQQQPCTTPRGLAGCGLPLSAQHLLPFMARGISSSRQTREGAGGLPTEVASTILAQSTVLALREELDMLSSGNALISFCEFAKLSAAAGCSKNHEEAAVVCSELEKACIVLRHKDSVYLRPEEIAEAVRMMMPSNRDEAERKLMEVEHELAGLEAIHTQLEKAASSRTNAMLTVGLVVLTTQFLAFYYLTWWELSWDVMEPIGYMISLFYSICAYIYFLGTKGSQFDLGPFTEYWSKYFLDSKKAKVEFDQERWDFLIKQRDRLKRHLGLSHQVMRAVTKH